MNTDWYALFGLIFLSGLGLVIAAVELGKVPFVKKLDFQDWLVLIGTTAVCSGVGFVYWPASLILFGLLCYLAVYMIARAEKAQ